MTDEKYVRANWSECEHRHLVLGHHIRVGNLRHAGWLTFCGHTEAKAWSVAAEFTRERMEQIRQLKRQIEWCKAGMS